MKKGSILITALICILALGIIVLGCDDGSKSGGGSNGGNGGGGKLTILNKPSEVSIGYGIISIYKNPDFPITTYLELLGAMIGQDLVEATAVSFGNPYDLGNLPNQYDPFKKTGKFMVALTFTDILYITDVDFSNGSATVDWNTMNKQSDLPFE